MSGFRQTLFPSMRLAMILALLVAVTSCTKDDDDGPLDLAGYGNILDGQERPPYFTIEMCIHDGAASDIEITDVAASGVEGTRKPLEFRVAWADGPKFTRTISARQPLPSAYVDAVGAEGTIGECGMPDTYASLAVVFPPVGKRAVLLTGVEVTYDLDGDTYTDRTEAFLAQCPAGTQARTDTAVGDVPLCRRSRAAD